MGAVSSAVSGKPICQSLPAHLHLQLVYWLLLFWSPLIRHNALIVEELPFWSRWIVHVDFCIYYTCAQTCTLTVTWYYWLILNWAGILRGRWRIHGSSTCSMCFTPASILTHLGWLAWYIDKFKFYRSSPPSSHCNAPLPVYSLYCSHTQRETTNLAQLIQLRFLKLAHFHTRSLSFASWATLRKQDPAQEPGCTNSEYSPKMHAGGRCQECGWWMVLIHGCSYQRVETHPSMYPPKHFDHIMHLGYNSCVLP